MNRALAALAFVTLSACITPPEGVPTGAQAQSLDIANPDVADIDSKPLGSSYSQWAARYWQWALSQKADVNPLVDNTGAHCGQGQTGNMFFLAGELGGGSVHRTCTVPFGKSIFVPVLGLFAIDTLDKPQPAAALRQLLADELDGAKVFATIDGLDVVMPEHYRERSPLFGAALPAPAASNVLGIDATECRQRPHGQFLCGPIVDDSYALILKPLAPGVHSIRVGGTTASGMTVVMSYEIQVPAPI
jgi:hypothetical protein